MNQTNRLCNNLKKLWIGLLSLFLLLGVMGCESSETDSQDDTPASMFAVVYQNITIELGKDASDLLERLGKPTSQSKVASCGEGAGDQWQYVYPSLYLFTVKNGDSEIVDGVALRDDMAETTKKIGIGASEAAMTEAYGEAIENGSKRRYTKGSYTLEFFVEDGVIAGIELRTDS